MIRSTTSLSLPFFVLLLAAALSPRPASAIEITQIGGPTVVNVGDTFTIELALENASRDSVQGIEVDLSGMAGTAFVVSGRATRYHFAQFCTTVSTFPTCFGALEPPNGAFWNNNDLTQGGYELGDDAVELGRYLALVPTTADGSIDPGVDRDGGPVDIRITLQAIGLGELSIDGRYSNGVDVLPIPGSPLMITIIPEPATALLFGLGLATLASSRRSIA